MTEHFFIFWKRFLSLFTKISGDAEGSVTLASRPDTQSWFMSYWSHLVHVVSECFRPLSSVPLWHIATPGPEYG